MMRARVVQGKRPGGSGTTSYRSAIAWGTAWTGVGALASAWFAVAMADTFGKGLFVPGTATTFTAAIAIICGAAAWVLIATRTGLPVSTTHAIVGSLAGVAVAAYGPQAGGGRPWCRRSPSRSSPARSFPWR